MHTGDDGEAMNIRHRLSNYFLLMACRFSSVRLFRRAAAGIARFIHGPLNPEQLYAKEPVMEQRLMRAKPRKCARPDTSMLPDAHPEDSDLEEWLAKEAGCAQ